MRTDENSLAIVKAFEGCLKPVKGRPGYFTAYRCPANVLTIGWGHTNHHEPKFDASTVWSQQQCDAALRNDLLGFEKHVAKHAPEVTLPHRFGALVSWSYNTGGPATAAVWKYARAGDVEGTRLRLDRWNQANGQVLAGLVRRRKSEGELFAGDIAAALKTAGAKPLPMPQRVDVPKPPAKDVAGAVKKETGAAAGGAATTGGTVATSKEPVGSVGYSLLEWSLIGVGVAVVLIGVVLAVRKARAFVENWA